MTLLLWRPFVEISTQFHFVCTGNTCRSPMAKAMLEDLISKGSEINTYSISGSQCWYERRKGLNSLGIKMLFIEPGSPWENGYIESFNGKLRDELLHREIFTTLMEAKVLIEEWRRY